MELEIIDLKDGSKLYHLLPHPNKKIKDKLSGEIYENDIWFGSNRTLQDFEEVEADDIE